MLNHDGGGVLMENGKPVQMEVTASEKVYADYELSTIEPGRSQFDAGAVERDLLAGRRSDTSRAATTFRSN